MSLVLFVSEINNNVQNQENNFLHLASNALHPPVILSSRGLGARKRCYYRTKDFL